MPDKRNRLRKSLNQNTFQYFIREVIKQNITNCIGVFFDVVFEVII